MKAPCAPFENDYSGIAHDQSSYASWALTRLQHSRNGFVKRVEPKLSMLTTFIFYQLGIRHFDGHNIRVSCNLKAVRAHSDTAQCAVHPAPMADEP